MNDLNLTRTFRLLLPCACVCVAATVCLGVTSQISRFSTAAELLKGETEDVIIDSRGQIQLARQSEQLDCGDLFKNIWSINTMLAGPDGAIYLGTSPNGDIIKYKNGKAQRVYPSPVPDAVPDAVPAAVPAAVPDAASNAAPDADPNSAPNSDPNSAPNSDPNSVQGDPLFTNEHIFAMALDAGGRVLAGISGANCRLVRLDGDKITTLFEPEDKDAKYILSIAMDAIGAIYVGTGPEGNIYRLSPFGTRPEVVYTCRDRNVLSLALGPNGGVYAGCDERGLVYKINPSAKSATVFYDSQQEEITALVFDGMGDLYAAATSAGAVDEKVKFDPIGSDAKPGKPDTVNTAGTGAADKNNSGGNSTKLEVANTDASKTAAASPSPSLTKRGSLPKSAGHIYRIDDQGFVTDLFSDMSVFFAMGMLDDRLLLGTGNEAQLFTVDPLTEEKAILYEDDKSSQITAMVMVGGTIYVGCANPPKLIGIAESYAVQGTYDSELIDAGQPARWGKLQIDADIPAGCAVLLSARSGNVDDPNDPTFSAWTEPAKITRATELNCPIGRFCQYRLALKTDDASKTPTIREIAAAHVIPNLAPRVESVTVTRVKAKQGIMKIAHKASDRNKDTLVYTVNIRKVGRESWIEIKDDLTAAKLEWDSQTVEDGRYEMRVTADDKRSNTARTAMTGSRISEVFVVDNTAPRLKNPRLNMKNGKVIVTLELEDGFTAIGRLSYTVDSDDEWVGTLPNDLVYDTMREDFTVVIDDLESGSHVIALKMADHLDNTAYESFEITIK